MIGHNGMGNGLQNNRLTGPRLRHDQGTLSLANGRDQLNYPAGLIFQGRIIPFHDQPLIGIQRRQIIEMNLVLGLFRIAEINAVDFQQGEIALTILGRTDFTHNRIPGT